jgi:hypothetical protein
MKRSSQSLEKLVGARWRARHKIEMDNPEHYFENPLIHKEIHGDKVYIPLNLNRVWNEIN